jgi:hypothetical protein
LDSFMWWRFQGNTPFMAVEWAFWLLWTRLTIRIKSKNTEQKDLKNLQVSQKRNTCKVGVKEGGVDEEAKSFALGQ